MFFTFFESQSKSAATDPLILWLTGGPGCASSLAALFENGPFKVNEDGESLDVNPFGWNKNANVVYVDQPIGVGFSYGVKETSSNEEEVSDQLDTFVQLLLGHPTFAKYQKNDFFVFAESYGGSLIFKNICKVTEFHHQVTNYSLGHFGPSTTEKIMSNNKNPSSSDRIIINIKGLGIGNGWVDPITQYPGK